MHASGEFADEDAFNTGTHTEEFAASGKDARDRGLPRPSVLFADVS